MRINYLCLGTAALLAACGDDPVNYSAPVGINLKAKSSDVVNDVIDDEKGITTESGNPYGAFTAEAENRLGGAPSDISIDAVDLLLGGNSTGVAKLGDIFAGDVDVVFQMNDTDNSFPAATATISADTTAGPVGMDVTFDSDALGDADYDKLLGGSFKVILRGPAAAAFSGANADADLQVTFTFAAYE